MLSEILHTHQIGGVYLLLAFGIFIIGKWGYHLFNRDISIKDQLVEQDNLAFAMAHVGYLIGLLIVIGSVITGPSNGLQNDLTEISIYGLLAILLFNLSILIGDKIILPRFSIKKEIIIDRNVGAGVIEASIMVSSALIIFGAIEGESTHSLWFDMLLVLVFWAIGQLALILVSYVYQWITPYDIHEHIEKDNIAVAVGFSGALLAVANLIRFGIGGVFESWSSSFIEIGFDLGIGLILLPIMRYLTDEILLPGQKLTDEMVNQEKPNVGAALVEFFAYLGGSILITWCV